MSTSQNNERPKESRVRDWDFFWERRQAFQLGSLVTETPHPRTVGLATIARGSRAELEAAYAALHDVDDGALECLTRYRKEWLELRNVVRDVLGVGHGQGLHSRDSEEADVNVERSAGGSGGSCGRVFVSGCGATGRLALLIEKVWREWAPEHLRERVVGFMAGGDCALVKSIEGFEDHPEYAHRVLSDMGARDEDLVVGVTEGGETPFVLGAVDWGRSNCRRHPWLVYCNPNQVLRPIERSWRLISAPDVRAVSLEIGPMALAGSTRMQATTVQTLFVGLALLSAAVDPTIDLCDEVQKLRSFWNFEAGCAPLTALARLTEFEAGIYANGGFTTYVAPVRLGLTVLTDTTERAPTFSLLPFENVNDASHVDPRFWSLCFLSMAMSDSTVSLEELASSNAKPVPEFDEAKSERVWASILGGRQPRTLEWDVSLHLTGRRRLLGFDISERSLARRSTHSTATIRITALSESTSQPHSPPSTSSSAIAGFIIEYVDAAGTCGQQLHLDTRGMHALTAEVALKLALNAHSTLVAGRIGRFESNVMTFVAPSNCKLIDRAVRYVQYLLRQRGRHLQSTSNNSSSDVEKEKIPVESCPVEAPEVEVPYEEIALTLKQVADQIGPTDSIVMKTYEALLTRK